MMVKMVVVVVVVVMVVVEYPVVCLIFSSSPSLKGS
jgi:hypothetical protein